MAEENQEDQVQGGGTAPSAGSGRSSRKTKRNVTAGVAHIEATFNNTRVTVTDQQGNVLAWSSGGRLGHKGSRKSTGYVAQLVGQDAGKRARDYGMQHAEVHIKGPGSGRESAVRGFSSAGIEVSTLKDVTPVPHNGCRPPKRRRV